MAKRSPITLFAKRWFRRAMIACGVYGPLVWELARTMDERPPVKKPGEYDYTLLALKPLRFRGDLDILSRDFGFRVLQFKAGWQQKLLELFWDKKADLGHGYYQPHDEHTRNIRAKIQNCLKALLPRLFRKVGVDCVLTAATYYVDDQDYAVALEDMGFPMVSHYRECFVSSQNAVNWQTNLAGMLGRFHGSRLLVHNETLRQLLVDCGYVPADKIQAPGCMRMDAYVGKVLADPGRHATRKRVTLFSFVPCAVLPHICTSFTPGRDVGFVKLFDQVHQSFAQLAAEHPEIDFLIKPKWGASWIDEIKFSLEQVDIDADTLPNLEINAALDAQQVILDSDVVITWGSTIMVEAAITDRPIIIPHFAECTEEQYKNFMLLEHYYDAYDIARGPEELKSLVLRRLEDPAIPEDAMRRRREAFERYLSPIRADASRNYAQIIRQVIEEHRSAKPSA